MPNEKKLKIAGLGETLWDIYEQEKFVGGSATNFSVHVAQSGQDAYLFSRVGDDKNGRELLQKLSDVNVNTSGVQHDIFKPTGSLHISLDEEGNPDYHCTKDVAFDYMRLDSIWEELAPQMDAVFFGMLAQRNDVSREAMNGFLKKATTALKVCDLNIRQWNSNTERAVNDALVFADIVKLNQSECSILKRGLNVDTDDISFLRQLLEKHAIRMVALTLGQHGCYLITAKEKEFDPGYSIKPMDLSGAGDAFAAGLVLKVLQQAPLSDVADFANKLGAYVSTKIGAVPDWSFHVLDEFITESI